MALTDFIGPALKIVGGIIGKKGSGETASAGARTQAALTQRSSAAEKRISDVRRTVTGFIDTDVDIKSGRGTAAPEAFASLYENPSSLQITALERLESRLREAQQRAR